MKVAAIDFETANRNPASVCSIGVSILEDGVLSDSYYSLIQPEENVKEFETWNVRIHGIQPEDVEDAPRWPQVYKELEPLLDGAIVTAHNAPFDMKCFQAACQNTGIPVPHFTYFDTVALSRRVFPQLPHHRLNDMCEFLGISLNHHNALSDSYGCLMIVVNVMEMIGLYEIEEMLTQCRVNTKRL